MFIINWFKVAFAFIMRLISPVAQTAKTLPSFIKDFVFPPVPRKANYICSVCGSPDSNHKVIKQFKVGEVVREMKVCPFVISRHGTKVRESLLATVNADSMRFGMKLAKKTYKKIRASHGKAFAKKARASWLKEVMKSC